MVHPIQFSSHFSCVVSINKVDSEVAWERVHVLIRWLPQKPANLDLRTLVYMDDNLITCGSHVIISK